MAREKPQTVHLRNPWATGFTGGLIELMVFLRRHPILSLVGLIEKIIKVMIAYYAITLAVGAILYGYIYDKLTLMATVSAMALLAYIGYRFWAEHKNYPAPTIRRLSTGVIRVNRVKRRWKKATKAGGFAKTPRIKKISSSPNGVIVQVNTGRASASVHKLAEGADEIAAVMGCNESKMEHITPGLANLHLVWGDPTSRLLTLHDIHQTGDKNRVGFGLDPNGYTVSMSLTTSVLIVGEAESGKSNTMWAILGGLVKKEIPFRLRVIDPAGGVELNRLQDSPLTLSYTDSALEIDSLVAYNLQSMHERMAKMKTSTGKIRKHVPTEDEPLEILLIDELLLLKNHDAQSPLAEIISTGRKSGHIVIALSQLSQVDSLGRVRDLFPQRMCLATKSADMTDSVLGPGAERDGAKCSRISKGTPGVGYYFSIERRMFTRFRTPEVTDRDADDLAEGRFPNLEHGRVRVKSPLSNRSRLARRKTAVYRLYDRSGELLYIGKTVHPNERFKEHAKEQIWWAEVDMSKTSIEWYPNWGWAGKVETASIRSERPKYNIVGAPLVMTSMNEG